MKGETAREIEKERRRGGRRKIREKKRPQSFFFELLDGSRAKAEQPEE